MPRSPIGSTSSLARHLGLSRWTISRVLNGHAEVKPETRRRVREAMDRLGFVPDPAGRALRGAPTGVVGVCFQAIGSPVVARKIASLQAILRRAGFRALFEVTDGRPDVELEVVRHFVAMKVDGLVLAGGMTEANAAAVAALLRQRAVPAVLVDPLRAFPVPSVALDRREGMRMALGHLLGLGHRSFALLGIDEAVLYGRVRWEALREAAAERGLSWTGQFRPLSEPEPAALDFAYGSRLAARLLEAGPRPSAVLALNDQVAIGAMSFLQKAGLHVPREISVVGFDNLDVSAHVHPGLTTVDQRVDTLMQTVVDALAARRAAKAGARADHRLVAPALVVRESTAPAPG